MDKRRQSVITKAYLERWSTLPVDVLFKNATEEEKRCYNRNRTMIDLLCMPIQVKDNIMQEYNTASIKAKSNGRRHIMKFLIDSRMANLVKNLEDF
jgi:hypothetical protein